VRAEQGLVVSLRVGLDDTVSGTLEAIVGQLTSPTQIREEAEELCVAALVLE
jgi:hypothetical protein